MRSSRGAAFGITSAALVAAMVVAPGCGSLLGLGDFADQKTDASASGGSAGTGGSGGATGGSGGVGAAGGSGGVTGGAGGSAPDGGDAGDAGPQVTCTGIETFHVLKGTQTTGLTASNSLFVATGNNEAYVVMGTENPAHVFVQRVTDQSGSSRLAEFADIQPDIHVTGAQIVGNTLHVTGYGNYYNSGWGQVDLSFSLQSPIDWTAPTVDFAPVPAPCATIQRAFYIYDSSGQRHSAMSCVEDADGGSGGMDLYVDGNPIGTNQALDGSYEVTSFALSHAQYVLVTGEAPGEGVVFYGSFGSASLTKSKKIQFGANGGSWPLAAWESTSGTSIILYSVRFDPDAGFGFPLDLYAGTVSDLATLDNVPPPNMLHIASVNSQPAIRLAGKPAHVTNRTLLAESTFGGDEVAFSVFAADGTPLALHQVVKQSSSTSIKYRDVAVGAIGNSVFVVWNEYNTDTSESIVDGELFDCN